MYHTSFGQLPPPPPELKICERFVLSQIQPFMEKSNDQSQFAYKKARSTLDAVGLLTSRHCRLLKYADDFVLCNSYKNCTDQEGLDEDLHRLVTWSADHGLLINKTKCAERLFYPKNTSPQLPLSLINGEALSREQTVKYLGVHFNSNLTWSTHIDSVFTKCLKISFFIWRLRSMNVHKSLLWRIVSACAIPIILYCSPIIFPGLFNKDFASIKKCIHLLSTSSGVAYTYICKLLISQRFNSCTRLSTSIINDPLHPLRPCLSKALSTSTTRSSFKLLRCRTSLHRNSLIPSLARLLVNPQHKVDLLSSNLS